jgi:hypothetical protein
VEGVFFTGLAPYNSVLAMKHPSNLTMPWSDREDVDHEPEHNAAGG